MNGVNKAIVLGHLGEDPKIKFLPEGGAVANLSIATSESWKSKTGEKQTRTEWHKVVLYGKIAEIAAEYLRKGSKAYIEGAIKTRKWTDKNNIERYTTEIVADTLQLIDSKPAQVDTLGNVEVVKKVTANSPSLNEDDELPF